MQRSMVDQSTGQSIDPPDDYKRQPKIDSDIQCDSVLHVVICMIYYVILELLYYDVILKNHLSFSKQKTP